MIELRDNTNIQIVRFLKRCVKGTAPVYNSNAIVTTPVESTRVEFKIDGFRSTGQIYQKTKPNEDFKIGSIAEYRCLLTIRVIGTPEFSNEAVVNIAGGIQGNGILEMYVDNLYVRNETLRMTHYPVQQDGVIYVISQITAECYVGIEYDSFDDEIGYFTKVEDLRIDIK